MVKLYKGIGWAMFAVTTAIALFMAVNLEWGGLIMFGLLAGLAWLLAHTRWQPKPKQN